jgi:CRISPR-associated protein Csb3
MSEPTHTIRIRVDATNPGQFFACCGLLELAERLNPGALGWFENDSFVISEGPSLKTLMACIVVAELTQLDTDDTTASPIQISAPFDLRLDWWKSGDKTSSDLKVWAGTMESFRIARAMQHAMRDPEFATAEILNIGMVAFDPDDLEKKVEPFYFDARRGPNAHSRDVGFAPNDLGMTTIASPAVELLCLIGLQRVRPVSAGKPRLFDYYTWSLPLPPVLAPVAAARLLPGAGPRGYRFESWFRTGQRKHKAFITAKPINTSQL